MNQHDIERYVAGRMGEAEARAFEDHCVAHPDFARQVELEQRLKAGMIQVARGPTAEFVRSHPVHRWQMAAAIAGILISMATLFYAWHRYVPFHSPDILALVDSEAERRGDSVRLALVRGEDGKPSLPAGLVRVEIAGLYDTGFQYSIALDRMDEHKNIKTVATLYGVRPKSPVTLEVMLDGDQLEPGAYSLRVRRQTSVDEPLDIEFLRD
jgi:hypothetical protein